jgi:hypothetical protein
MDILRHCAYECDMYGSDVVAAFGEYCAHRQRFLAHRPQLATKPSALTLMIQWLMRPETWRNT